MFIHLVGWVLDQQMDLNQYKKFNFMLQSDNVGPRPNLPGFLL